MILLNKTDLDVYLPRILKDNAHGLSDRTLMSLSRIIFDEISKRMERRDT